MIIKSNVIKRKFIFVLRDVAPATEQNSIHRTEQRQQNRTVEIFAESEEAARLQLPENYEILEVKDDEQ